MSIVTRDKKDKILNQLSIKAFNDLEIHRSQSGMQSMISQRLALRDHAVASRALSNNKLYKNKRAKTPYWKFDSLLPKILDYLITKKLIHLSH